MSISLAVNRKKYSMDFVDFASDMANVFARVDLIKYFLQVDGFYLFIVHS